MTAPCANSCHFMTSFTRSGRSWITTTNGLMSKQESDLARDPWQPIDK